MECPSCHQPLDKELYESKGYKFCHKCEGRLSDSGLEPASAIMLKDAVVGRVEQNLTGFGMPTGPLITVKDGVTGPITINITNPIIGGGPHVEGVEAPAWQPQGPSMRTRFIYVAYGRRILVYPAEVRDACGSMEPSRVFQIPRSLGSARSVGLLPMDGRLYLMVGTPNGVGIVDDQTAKVQEYLMTKTSKHGVNSVTILDGRIYATHSDFGLLSWTLDQKETEISIHPILGQGDPTRCIQRDGQDHLLLCAGSSLYRFPKGKATEREMTCYPSTGSALIGVASCGTHLYAAAADGRILRWEKDAPRSTPHVFHDLRCKAYGLSSFRQSNRLWLVVAGKSQELTLLGCDDVATQKVYRAPPGSILRFARAAPDLLVASGYDNRTLHVWDPKHAHAPRASFTIPDEAASDQAESPRRKPPQILDLRLHCEQVTN